jgi:AcrR family transcriptional regulator
MAHGQLYRYFPSREALLRALAGSAAREIQDRIGEARPDAVPVAEAVARITGGLIATGSMYIALAYLWPKPADAADPQVSEPLLQLFRRGVEDGALHGDLPAETLLGSNADLIEGSIIRSARAHAGVEETSAAVLSIFLSGAFGSRVTPARA